MSLFHSYKLKRRKVEPIRHQKTISAVTNQDRPQSDQTTVHTGAPPDPSVLSGGDSARPHTELKSDSGSASGGSSNGSCDECLDLSTNKSKHRQSMIPVNPPLLMGDIPGQGDGHKTMVWTNQANGQLSGQVSVTKVTTNQNESNSNSPSSTSTSPHEPDSRSTIDLYSTHAQNTNNSCVNSVNSELSSAPTIMQNNNNNTSSAMTSSVVDQSCDSNSQMICMICEDRATGLHYGIITCEGCKGFFKRTVQNKRVYTCVADGQCVITKQQRNRCQYCRFQKCLRQGMVLAAVREDRMPGGRNSGAVYNLYKVKYRKHKKPNNSATVRDGSLSQAHSTAMGVNANGGLTAGHGGLNSAGLILKSALTRDNNQSNNSNNNTSNTIAYNNTNNNNNNNNSRSGGLALFNNSQSTRLVERLNETNVSSLTMSARQTVIRDQSLAVNDCSDPRQSGGSGGGGGGPTSAQSLHSFQHLISNSMNDRNVMSREESDRLLSQLLDCDDFHDFGSLSALDLSSNSTTETQTELTDRLCSIGDSIVYRLVQWTKRLPFYDQLPVHVHTQLLTHKWHELLVLSTCAFQAIQQSGADSAEPTNPMFSLEKDIAESMKNLAKNLSLLNQQSSQTCISWQQLESEAGHLVAELCSVRFQFKAIRLTLEEFVCLKVVAMTTIAPNCDFFDTNVVHIRDKYLSALITHLSQIQAKSQQQRHDVTHQRMTSLLSCLQHVTNAATLLLQSKMFYVPFLMNMSGGGGGATTCPSSTTTTAHS